MSQTLSSLATSLALAAWAWLNPLAAELMVQYQSPNGTYTYYESNDTYYPQSSYYPVGGSYYYSPYQYYTPSYSTPYYYYPTYYYPSSAYYGWRSTDWRDGQHTWKGQQFRSKR